MPISFSTTTTCAELDTGSNSAKPCTAAKMITRQITIAAS
jgi:hypothetical protein